MQRFREGFTSIPPAARLGSLHGQSPVRARALAERIGWVLALELRAVGIDFSFAPVLDLGGGPGKVIGERALHHDPEVVVRLARPWIAGMRKAGMAAVGKHFPGHGYVEADSHLSLPTDDRDLESLRLADLTTFERLVESGSRAQIQIRRPSRAFGSMLCYEASSDSRVPCSATISACRRLHGRVITFNVPAAPWPPGATWFSSATRRRQPPRSSTVSGTCRARSGPRASPACTAEGHKTGSHSRPIKSIETRSERLAVPVSEVRSPSSTDSEPLADPQIRVS